MSPTTARHTTIPAAPGWMHCTPILDADGAVTDFHEAPVIAWIVTAMVDASDGELASCWAQAVVADESISAREAMQYLKRPDGLYVAVEFGWYKTRQDLIAAMQEDATAAQKRAAARQSTL